MDIWAEETFDNDGRNAGYSITRGIANGHANLTGSIVPLYRAGTTTPIESVYRERDDRAILDAEPADIG